jgi:hypothetical protein
MTTKTILIPKVDMYKAHSDQPFYLLNDEAHSRMLKKLKEEGGTSKSYLRLCPHKSIELCKCEYYINYLDDDGDIVRSVNGVIKPVLSISMYKEIISNFRKNNMN